MTLFAISFPFDNVFHWTGTHLEWRAIVHGNSNGNNTFVYPLDAWYDRGSSRRTGMLLGCQSALGTRAASHLSVVNGIGELAAFFGYSEDPAGGLLAVLTFGASTTVYLGLPLPFDLGQLGAPGCWVINDIIATVTNTTTPITGAVFDSFLVPNNLAPRERKKYCE